MYIPEIHEQRKKISGLKMPRRYAPRLPGASTKGQAPVNPFSGNKMKVASRPLATFHAFQKSAYLRDWAVCEEVMKVASMEEIEEYEQRLQGRMVKEGGVSVAIQTVTKAPKLLSSIFKSAPKAARPPTLPKPIGLAAPKAAVPKTAPAGGAAKVVDDVPDFSKMTAGEAKAAYRQQAQRLHPDKGGSAEAFKNMKNAYRGAHPKPGQAPGAASGRVQAPGATPGRVQAGGAAQQISGGTTKALPSPGASSRLPGSVTKSAPVAADSPLIGNSTLGKALLGGAVGTGALGVTGATSYGAGRAMTIGEQQNIQQARRGFNYGIR